MTVLTDTDILKLNENGTFISPFNCELEHFNTDKISIPSYGLSSCGYDVKLAPYFKIAKHVRRVVDVLEKDTSDLFEEVNAREVTIPAFGFVLGHTEEIFEIPTDVVGSLFCKSTLARKGLNLPPTVIEPGWKGQLVVEIFNMNPYSIRLHAGIGIGQIIFFRLNNAPMKPYDDTRKYQNQRGVQEGIYKG